MIHTNGTKAKKNSFDILKNQVVYIHKKAMNMCTNNYNQNVKLVKTKLQFANFDLPYL